MVHATAHTCLCQIPVQDVSGSETASRLEPIPRFQRMVGARRAAMLRRGGRGESGSVRSCLLLPELTASLRVRQTPHPTALPPRRNAHTPLLHATLCIPFSGSSTVRVTGDRRCWCKLLAFICSRLTHTHSLTHTQSHTPLLVDGVTARGV